MALRVVTGDLFDVPPGPAAVLVHSCNAYGVWGSGVAAEMKKRFPKAFEEYAKFCKTKPRERRVGDYILSEDSGYKIVSLVTSLGYGKWVAPPDVIVENTYKAVEKLFTFYRSVPLMFYSPKINSGLFNVPWERTHRILDDLCFVYNRDWEVRVPA